MALESDLEVVHRFPLPGASRGVLSSVPPRRLNALDGFECLNQQLDQLPPAAEALPQPQAGVHAALWRGEGAVGSSSRAGSLL